VDFLIYTGIGVQFSLQIEFFLYQMAGIFAHLFSSSPVVTASSGINPLENADVY
jgi:hypothetical protein